METKIGVKFLIAGVTDVPIFSSKDQRSRLQNVKNLQETMHICHI